MPNSQLNILSFNCANALGYNLKNISLNTLNLLDIYNKTTAQQKISDNKFYNNELERFNKIVEILADKIETIDYLCLQEVNNLLLYLLKEKFGTKYMIMENAYQYNGNKSTDNENGYLAIICKKEIGDCEDGKCCKNLTSKYEKYYCNHYTYNALPEDKSIKIEQGCDESQPDKSSFQSMICGAYPSRIQIIDIKYNGISYFLVNCHAIGFESQSGIKKSMFELLHKFITENKPTNKIIVVGDFNENLNTNDNAESLTQYIKSLKFNIYPDKNDKSITSYHPFVYNNTTGKWKSDNNNKYHTVDFLISSDKPVKVKIETIKNLQGLEVPYKQAGENFVLNINGDLGWVSDHAMRIYGIDYKLNSNAPPFIPVSSSKLPLNPSAQPFVPASQQQSGGNRKKIKKSKKKRSIRKMKKTKSKRNNRK